jgi:DNA replication protein DnaC
MDLHAIADLVEYTRQLAQLDECPDHEGETTTRCGACRSNALGSRDTAAVRRLDQVRTMAACDRAFPRRYRDALPDQPDVVAWIDRTVTDPGDATSLLLLGGVGRGKTWQAYGALRAVLAERPSLQWQATAFADFAAALRPRPGVDSETEMDRYRGAGLLLLDDIGTAKGSEWVEEITYRLVSHRYDAMLPTIYATNFAPDQLRDALGDRIASRLAETCVRVVLDGPDRRRHIRAA